MCTGALYNAQDLLLYYPEQPPTSRFYVDSPSSFGLQYENVFIRSHDGTQLHVQFIRQPPHRSSTAPTIVFFHGNAGNIGHRLSNVQLLYSCCDVNILLVEYRGYGKSCGRPSEQGLSLSLSALESSRISRATEFFTQGRGWLWPLPWVQNSVVHINLIWFNTKFTMHGCAHQAFTFLLSMKADNITRLTLCVLLIVFFSSIYIIFCMRVNFGSLTGCEFVNCNFIL